MEMNNSFFRQPILQVILAITITAPAYAQFDRILEYKGRWSCMTTDNFTYEYGTLKKEENKPFGLVIGEDFVRYSGGAGIGTGNLKIIKPKTINIIASNNESFFKFHHGEFIWSTLYNYPVPAPPTSPRRKKLKAYLQIGTCEKF